MATSYVRLLVNVAGLVTTYAVAIAPGSAGADNTNAAAAASAELAELVQWHSGMTVTSASCIAPEWKSAITKVETQDTAALLALHGAPGLMDMGDQRYHHSPNSPDAATRPVPPPTTKDQGAARKIR